MSGKSSFVFAAALLAGQAFAGMGLAGEKPLKVKKVHATNMSDAFRQCVAIAEAKPGQETSCRFGKHWEKRTPTVVYHGKAKRPGTSNSATDGPPTAPSRAAKPEIN